MGRALTAAALDGDFGEDRHRDLFRRDRAEIEAGRGLDAIDRLARDAAGDELFAQRDHLAAAADESVIFGVNGNGLLECYFIALALGRNHDEAARIVEIARLEAVDNDVRIGLARGSVAGAASVT